MVSQAGGETRLNEIKARLRDEGYRLTPQRLALVRALSGTDEHPSAADLYEQIRDRFPTTSLATVYKTLDVLKDLGEVLELGFSDDDNRYDGKRPYAHPHLVCICCHRIVDPEVSLVKSLESEVSRNSGYHIVGRRLDFYGVCPNCQSKG